MVLIILQKRPVLWKQRQNVSNHNVYTKKKYITVLINLVIIWSNTCEWSSKIVIAWVLELAHLNTVVTYFLFVRTRCKHLGYAQTMTIMLSQCVLLPFCFSMHFYWNKFGRESRSQKFFLQQFTYRKSCPHCIQLIIFWKTGISPTRFTLPKKMTFSRFSGMFGCEADRK